MLYSEILTARELIYFVSHEANHLDQHAWYARGAEWATAESHHGDWTMNQAYQFEELALRLTLSADHAVSYARQPSADEDNGVRYAVSVTHGGRVLWLTEHFTMGTLADAAHLVLSHAQSARRVLGRRYDSHPTANITITRVS